MVDHGHELPPTSAIQNDFRLPVGAWFEYPVRAQPHHTDYGGGVWHGSFIAWMEEARVECLRSIGIDYADLVAMGCELPVVELSIRYHQPIRMGALAIVRTQMASVEGVRINWDYQIQAPNEGTLYATARVTLVTVDREKGKILRQLPPAIQEAFARLGASPQ